MTTQRKTVIVTGASQGIGAAVANLFHDRGYNVVANSRHISRKNELPRSEARGAGRRRHRSGRHRRQARQHGRRAVRLDRCAGQQRGHFHFEAVHRVHAGRFSSAVGHEPGGFPVHHSRSHQTALVAEHRRQRGEHHRVHCRSSARGVAGVRGDDHQGRHQCDLAQPRDGVREAGHSRERGCSGCRRDAVARSVPQDFLRSLSPLGEIGSSKDIAEAVLYLTEASQVTGEVHHVNGGSHLGKW